MKIKGAKNRVEIIKLPDEISQSQGRFYSGREEVDEDSSSGSDSEEKEGNETKGKKGGDYSSSEDGSDDNN